MRRGVFGIGVQAVAVAALLVAGCSSKSVLNQHQLHTLLQCPCPTIAPQATYVLPADFQCCNLVEATLAPPWNSEIGQFDTSGTETNLWEVGGLPRAIIAGPDGNPWFADEANETVVRL
jgi:hypothetical protein